MTPQDFYTRWQLLNEQTDTYQGPVFPTYPSGRQPIGVNQQQGGNQYPFVDPSVDIQHLIADMQLSYTDDTAAFVRPFHVVWLQGFGDSISLDTPLTIPHDRDLLIADANGQTVFDSRLASYTESAWGDRLSVCSWTTNTAVLAVVRYTAWSSEDDAISYPIYFEPESAVLDERVCLRLAPRVRSLRVGDTTISSGRVILRNGYNTLLTPGVTGTDTVRPATAVVIDAEAGAGLGRYPPDCEAGPVPIRRINSQGPLAGNFLLDASNCYRVDRPVVAWTAEAGKLYAEVRAAALRIANDCAPCCDCSDYLAVYEAIRRLRDRLSLVVPRLNTLRENYIANLTKFLRSKQCREDTRLKAIMEPECPGRLAIACGYCNQTDRCLKNVILIANFDTAAEDGCNDGASASATLSGSTPTVVCNSCYRGGNTQCGTARSGGKGRSHSINSRYTLGGAWPHLWAHFDQVQPGAQAYVTWRMDFLNASTGDNVGAFFDAYELGKPPVVASAAASPVPGYTWATGPNDDAKALRLVTCPLYIASGLDDHADAASCCE